jgi:hypothetical protein
MIGRPAQMLVAVGIVLAGMSVLVAAGRQPPTTVLQPPDPSEVVPASLSRQVFSTWARANLGAQQAVETLGRRLTRCTQRPQGHAKQQAACRARVLDDFDAHVQVALERARMLFPAGGRCGRALRIYAEKLHVYSSAVRWYDSGTSLRPYSETGLIGLRERNHLAASVVFEACASVL